MTAEEYTETQLSSGTIGAKEVVELVRHWQKGHSLVVDGKCGPKTLATIRSCWDSGSFGLLVLDVAISELGNGEEGGNNSGPHVAKYKGIPDDGDPDNDGAWCASFISWCSIQAASKALRVLPYDVSHGAKRLFKNIVKGGGILVSSPRPGDIVCWDRGTPGSWQGHIGVVESVDDGGVIHTIEGNVGRYPSKVRRFMHYPGESKLEGFVRID